MGTIGDALKLLLRPGWAGGRDLLPPYERLFAEAVGGGGETTALAFGRARVALWSILKALEVTEEDEVVLPAYTCETVPVAVKFTGVRCRYADVGVGQFNTTPSGIIEQITDRTRAVVCQHTYGTPHPMRELTEVASRRAITVVGDGCLLISPHSPEGNVVVAASASIFSTQWSKPFSTGLGGMALLTDPQLLERVREIRDGFDRSADRRRSRSLAMQNLLYPFLVRPRTKAVMARVYRWATRLGLVRGSTDPDEYSATMPDSFPAGATNVQAVLGQRQLRRWQENVEHRRELTALYLRELSRLGMDVSVLEGAVESPVLWGVPVLLENKQEILERAGRAGLPTLMWYDRTPVHIAPETAAQYDYTPGLCPRAERLFDRELYLSTAPVVTRRKAEAAIHMLERHAALCDWHAELR